MQNIGLRGTVNGNVTVEYDEGTNKITYSKIFDETVYTKELVDAKVQEINEIIGDDLNERIETVEAVAKGRSTGYVFDTYLDLQTWLLDEDNVSKLVLGDNLYIRATDVPDYWWDGNNIQQLETQKVELSGYATKEELNDEVETINDKLSNTVLFLAEFTDGSSLVFDVFTNNEPTIIPAS